MRLLLLIVIVGLLVYGTHFLHTPPLYAASLNPPGELVDVGSTLARGRYTVVHYYADWCPNCKAWKPTIDAMQRDSRFADVKVVLVNIGDLDSAIAARDRIGFVPNFKVYDGSGRLVASDKAADRWLRQLIAARVGG